MFLDHSIETYLTERIKTLEAKSRDYAWQSESAKLLPAMLTAGGIIASIVNPTAPLFAVVGLAGYAASVLLDHHNTGRLTPIPCNRASLREIKDALLADEPIVKSLFDTTIDALAPGDRQEYFILVHGFNYLVQMLSQVSPEYREALYEKAWRNPSHYLPQVQTIEVLEAEPAQALPAGVTINNEVSVSPTIAAPVVHVSVASPATASQPPGYETAHPSAFPTGVLTCSHCQTDNPARSLSCSVCGSHLQNGGAVTNYGSTAATPTVSPPRITIAMPQGRPQSSQWEKGTLPTIDLTRSLAVEHNVLISAKRDSGKTTTVKAAIRHRYEQTGGNCIFWIADPKGSQFLGLENSPAHYLFVDDRNIEELVGMLEAAHIELKRRIDVRRDTQQPTTDPVLTLLLDEWLSLLVYCQDKKEVYKEVLRLAKILAVQGREDRVNLWISTHSHLVQDCGFPSTVRDNFAVYALGRKAPGKAAAMESLQAAMADQYLMRDQDLKVKFLAELRDHPPSYTPVIFTPTDGGVLCQLPDLSDFVNWEYPLPVAECPVSTEISGV